MQRASSRNNSASHFCRYMYIHSFYCSLADADAYSENQDDICAELEDSLEELEEGLDVLMILEKAYEKALRSHVRPAQQGSSSGSSRSPSPADGSSRPIPAVSSALSSHSAEPSHATRASPGPVPLFEGSSTALVAILEHPSSRPQKLSVDTSLFHPQPVTSNTDGPEVSTDGAVIRIAHLGDCMGMLVRGEEVVWRTEEMWWSVSTPNQLTSW